MRTTRGPQRVDVIYRRIDDDFLDPLVFRPDSLLGVPGSARRLSRRATSRSPTPSAPASPTTSRSIRTCRDMIRFYLGEEPILPNVPTWHAAQARRPAVRPRAPATSWWSRRCTARAATACWSGPRHAGASARSSASAIIANPEQLHRPADARAVDLPDVRRRPASRRATSTCGRTCSPGATVTIVPGGLTRVALREGSLVVNSSQGGGTKDTWVLDEMRR